MEDFQIFEDYLGNTSLNRKNVLSKKALEEYNAGNNLKSLYLQVQAVNSGFLEKYTFNSDIDHTKVFKNTHPLPRNRSQRTEDLLNFVKQELKFSEDNIGQQFETLSLENAANTKSDIVKLGNNLDTFVEKCAKLPKEWTVIQVSKCYNPITTISFASEISTAEKPLFLGLLHHCRSDKYNKPFCIQIDCSINSNNIYDKFYNLHKDIKERSSFTDIDLPENRVKYWEGMDKLEKDIEDVVNHLKLILGPWIALFAGDSCDKKFQKELFKEVDQFSDEHKLSYTSIVLLSYIVRKLPELTEVDIKQFNFVICNLENNNKLVKSIEKFLTSLKKYFKKEEKDFKPCILILDEVIDHFLWEMTIPKQEICRVSSLDVLEKLLLKYGNNLKDGYVQICINNGFCLVNPDKTLHKMELRMSNFFSNLYPQWTCLRGKAPTSDKLQEWLTTSEIFIYCGHGSGLQYLNGHKIKKLDIQAPVFLFGCESVKLKSHGLHSEMTGSHFYYHAANSVAVIGCLAVALDYQLDKLSTEILSRWIPSKINWSNVDKKIWRDSGIIRDEKYEKHEEFAHVPYLPKVISTLRQSTGKIYNRALLVYRGLPLCYKP